MRIKSRNFLTIISYNGIKKEDLWASLFFFDIDVLTSKNIDPFPLERKIFDLKKREIINTFWEDCNKPSFYKLICKPHNFLYLNGKKIIYPRVADNVWKS